MKILNKTKLKRMFVSRTQTALTSVQSEIAIMKKLNHPNIISLKEVLDDPNCNKLYIIMELATGGSL